MNDKNIIVGTLVLLVAVGAILFAVNGNPSTKVTLSPDGTAILDPNSAVGPYVPLAQCLKNNGATFYGAFWCPHCQSQKKLFGEAVPALPYVECSTADGNSQNLICKNNRIESYPTWVFADGSRETGEVSLEKLAEKSNCTQTLPGAMVPSGAETASSAPQASAASAAVQ